VSWDGPAQLTGLDSAQKKGGPISAHQVFGPISAQQSLLFPSGPDLAHTVGLGQSQPGWARVSLAHKHIRNGPEPAWPSERNPSVLGQNRPGPALENQPVGGIIFPPSSCMQNERSACRRKTQKTKRNKGGRKVYLMRRRRCPAG